MSSPHSAKATHDLSTPQFLNDKLMVQRYLESIKSYRNLPSSDPLLEIVTVFNFKIPYAKLIFQQIRKDYAKKLRKSTKRPQVHYFNKHAQAPLAKNIETEEPKKQDRVNLKDVKPLDGIVVEWKGENKMHPVDQRSYRTIFEE